MELAHTVDMMLSDDPIERLKAEYYQTQNRVDELRTFLRAVEDGEKDLPPNTTYNLLNRQYQTMLVYLNILEERLELLHTKNTLGVESWR